MAPECTWACCGDHRSLGKRLKRAGHRNAAFSIRVILHLVLHMIVSDSNVTMCAIDIYSQKANMSKSLSCGSLALGFSEVMDTAASDLQHDIQDLAVNKPQSTK